jgi:hypothetical protein
MLISKLNALEFGLTTRYYHLGDDDATANFSMRKEEMGMPYPDWINRLPNGPQKLRQMNRFRIRLAALYASPDGSLCELADRIGVGYHALKSQVQSERCLASGDTKEGIRRILGNNFMPPDRPTNGDWSNLF